METLLSSTPPQSLEAEQSVLGAVLVEREAMTRVAEFLHSEHFYKDAHRFIYEAMVGVDERGEPVDLITVTQELRNKGLLEKAGNVDYMQSLMDLVPTAANAEHYGQLVVEKFLHRKLIEAGHRIAALGYSGEEKVGDLVDKAEQLIFSISQGRIARGFYPIDEVLTAAFERIEELYSKKAHITGISTGFPDLDEITAGLQSSDLIVVAARPSMGKTSLCLNIAVHAAVRDKAPVAVFSLETAKEQMVLRMLCSEAGIDAQKLRTGNLKEDDWPRLSRAIQLLSRTPIYIDDTGGVSAQEIRSKARRLKQEKKNLGLIIVDHLQLVRGPKSENKVQEIAEISRSMKFLAKELNVPVIMVSQLNRAVETRNDKRPLLADLRESGAIEQDADLIVFIYRDDYYHANSDEKGIAELIVSKQRNGPVGTVKLNFWKECTKFRPLDTRHRHA